VGKVLKNFLNTGFTPIDNTLFSMGTSIDFDCYIQRFNGFVILIESGTLLDEKVYAKITRPHLQVYVKNTMFKHFKHYVTTYSTPMIHPSNTPVFATLNEAINASLCVKNKLELASSMHEKLKIIYMQTKDLLNAWLVETKDHFVPIPLEAADHLMEYLIELVNAEETTLSTFNTFLDEKESLTAHLIKVTFFTSIIGSHCKFDYTDQKKLLLAALFHDVGKSELDEELLNKPDRLSDTEYQSIKMHSEASVKILRQSGLKDRTILTAIHDHHERLDGSGYPSGLRANRISLFGKIIAVCDMFDALITIKPYRAAYKTFNALHLIRKESRHKLELKYINLLIKHSG